MNAAAADVQARFFYSDFGVSMPYTGMGNGTPATVSFGASGAELTLADGAGYAWNFPAMSLPLWRPRPTRLSARVWGECVSSYTCGRMVQTKSLVGDLDAGRKLTREVLWRRDARLSRFLRASQVSWCCLLLRIAFP